MNILKKLFFSIFFSINLFATLDFTNPTSTPAGTPDLVPGGSIQKMVTDTTGQYVYAIWSKFDGLVTRIQVAISSDYGVNWTYPVSTQWGTPNLSEPGTSFGEDAKNPEIATDDSGQYVYAIWGRNNGTDYIVQMAYSDDYGVNWSNVTDLADVGTIVYNSGLAPKISTDSSGQYVYAVWTEDSGASGSVESAYSNDFGQSWTNVLVSNAEEPGEVQLSANSTGQYVYAIWKDYISPSYDLKSAYSNDFGQSWTPVPNLVTANSNISNYKIINSDSGQYVYAIWLASDGIVSRAQVGISSNYGVSWSSPLSTPATDGSPNLSQPRTGSSDGAAGYIGITASSSGQKIYAIWARYDGTISRVQVAISSNYGNTWINPTATTASDGSPNLSEPRLGSSDGDSANCQIATNSTGTNVYAVWSRTNVSLKKPAQLAMSSDSGITWTDPTTTPPGTTPPDLSLVSVYSIVGVSTNFSGEYVYTIWNDPYGPLQVANGLFSVSPFRIAFPISLMPIKN
ncbi:MAG: sialidase family protein [Parachlamydiales bacterium]|jgi:hypothetical protein